MPQTITLETKLTEIPSFRPKLLAELQKLNIITVRELLYYLPFRYEDFSNMVPIAELVPGEPVSILGAVTKITAQHALFGRVGRADAVVSDGSASIKVVWFNQPYLADTLPIGTEVFLAGTVTEYKGLQLQNPLYEKMSTNAETVHTARIVPIYHLTANLPLRSLRAGIFSVLSATDNLSETLPKELLKKYKLLPLPETIRNLHFPESIETLEAAQMRMAFEEIFTIQVALQKHRVELKKEKSYPIPFNNHLIKEFLSQLPFTLTTHQKQAIWDIIKDIEKPTPMNRLLEGDVGSGKTLVALVTMLEVAEHKLQTVLLCPTEILAQQHYKSALTYFEQFSNISVMLLTSGSSELNGTTVSKKAIIEEIAHGGPQVIISTHAILQKSVKFKKLAYIVIDEQHRFGVRQRAALAELSGSKKPHLLSMSATPIPRSLKLSMFGDLDISEIKAKPTGRKPIATKLVSAEARSQAYSFVESELKLGRQAFVVTPLIETNDMLGVKAATAEQKNLQALFPTRTIALLHGRMKATEKETIMAEFLSKKSDILVSTSVIEVGVDVPNATVMVIEGADRFGLAQLHQLRGRVGRSEHQSYCLLFTENKNEMAINRLEDFAKTFDGFALAELDLQTRGFGNLYGNSQSGYMRFNYFSFHKHQTLLTEARAEVRNILGHDPELKKYPLLKALAEQADIHLE